MKAIFIQTVRNGWIVHEQVSCDFIREPLAVFNRMEDLQAALPDLLAVPPEFRAGDSVQKMQALALAGPDDVLK